MSALRAVASRTMGMTVGARVLQDNVPFEAEIFQEDFDNSDGPRNILTRGEAPAIIKQT